MSGISGEVEEISEDRHEQLLSFKYIERGVDKHSAISIVSQTFQHPCQGQSTTGVQEQHYQFQLVEIWVDGVQHSSPVSATPLLRSGGI